MIMLTQAIAQRGFVYRFAVCLLLICMVICWVVVPPAQAVAIADDLLIGGILVVLGAIWMSSDAIFPSQEDLWRACQNLYDTVIKPSGELLSEVSALASQYLSYDGHGGIAINVSSRLWQAVCGGPSLELIKDGFMGDVSSMTFADWQAAKDWEDETGGIKRDWLVSNNITSVKINGDYYYCSPAGDHYNFYCNGNLVKSTTHNPSNVSLHPRFFVFDYHATDLSIGAVSYAFASGSMSATNWYLDTYLSHINDLYDYPITITYPVDAIPISGTIVKPADDIAVSLPTTKPTVAVDGTVTQPDIPLDKSSYQVPVADIPIIEGATTVPEDTVVDITTGEIVDGSTDIPDNPDVPVNPDIPSTGIAGLLQGLWDFLAGILQQILDAINALGQAILTGLGELLKSLFVPSDTFFADNYNDILGKLKVKMPIDAYNSFANQLQNIQGKQLHNITVVLYGREYTVVDWSWYLQSKTMFDNIIRGFAWVGLLLFNINKVYNIFRNSSLFTGGPASPGTEIVVRKDD